MLNSTRLSHLHFTLACAAVLAASGAGCSKTAATAGAGSFSIDAPSGIVTAISNAVNTSGNGFAASRLSASRTSSNARINPKILFSSSDCDEHGDPVGTDSSQGGYPGNMTYCKLTVNSGSPDTIQGAFELIRGISCAAERAGIVFDGAAHDLSVTLDTNCFTLDQVHDMAGSTTVDHLTATISATASKPWADNTHFASGITFSMEQDGKAHVFGLGVNVSSNGIEVGSYENWGTNHDEDTAFAGSLDFATGELRAEARTDRFNCSPNPGRCGWARHFRVFSELEMSGTNPTGTKSVSFGYSEIYNAATDHGSLVTASGSLASGVKARFWASDNLTTWTEATNTKCYGAGGADDLGTCGPGLVPMSNNTIKTFSQVGGSSYSSPQTWFDAYNGFAFTSVDVDQDTQN